MAGRSKLQPMVADQRSNRRTVPPDQHSAQRDIRSLEGRGEASHTTWVAKRKHMLVQLVVDQEEVAGFRTEVAGHISHGMATRAATASHIFACTSCLRQGGYAALPQAQTTGVSWEIRIAAYNCYLAGHAKSSHRAKQGNRGSSALYIR